MPIYDYVCHHCGHRFEVIHGVHADGPTTCPACGGGPVRKAISAPSIHFKGSGWAKKDRGSAARKAASEAAPAATSADGGSGDGGSSSDGSAPAASTASSTESSSKAKPTASSGGSASGGSAATARDRD